ncbi:hypothetical protein E2C01_092402 [Portunus trituberculatus]|uniref:Uncharacterized protein n=1 Tax=Portunus trituberculatus TaxID=210409 RepID=A0A5B7JQG9_PORTR|nr:hypothetical protein [Portunus trituberculatus]
MLSLFRGSGNTTTKAQLPNTTAHAKAQHLSSHSRRKEVSLVPTRPNPQTARRNQVATRELGEGRRVEGERRSVKGLRGEKEGAPLGNCRVSEG